jgi:hypothetical protein
MMKEKQNMNEPAVDPGYLMLAVYVLGVTFLVLFAWLGGSTAALENEQQGQKQIVTHELMTEQPVTVADHFMTDKG